jgi:ADP-heptose:LPS heptosyltransferase
MLAWLSGAPRRVGYWTGGGGALLTRAEAFDPAAHVSANARRLVGIASGHGGTAGDAAAVALAARLAVPADAVARAAALLGGLARPWVGVHVGGGRPSKQWHLDRFAEVALRLARERGATIVLTGSAADRPMTDAVAARLPPDHVRVVNAAGVLDLVGLAGLLASLDLLVTGDTGPMHLAAAVGAPVVALFGPADPRRYGPLAARQRVIRVDLPCSPCGQVRLPPERCRGRIPDCMDGITADAVSLAAANLLDRAADAPEAKR